MFEFIRRHASVLASLLLAWMTWSDLQDPDAGKPVAGKTKPEGIADVYLAQRDPDQEPLALRDPCGIIDLERPGPSAPKPGSHAPKSASGPVATRSPAERLDEWVDALGARGASLVGNLQSWDPFELRRLATTPVHSAPKLPPARFSLYLNATLDLAEGGIASISGQTISVGEALVGMDVHSPPVLASVSGTTAVVSWRDELLLLDLLSQPSVHIGGPPLNGNPNGAAQSASAAAGPKAGGTGPKPRNGHGPKPRPKR